MGEHGQTHLDAVSKIVGEFVPLAELVFPVLRKPLLEKLSKDLDGLEKTLVANPEGTCRMLQLDPSDDELNTLSKWGDSYRDHLLGLWRDAIDGIESEKSLSTAHFVDGLLTDITWAMELQGQWKGDTNGAHQDEASISEEAKALASNWDLSPHALEGLLRGELAFRTLMAFMRSAREVLDHAGPRPVPVDLGFRRPS